MIFTSSDNSPLLDRLLHSISPEIWRKVTAALNHSKKKLQAFAGYDQNYSQYYVFYFCLGMTYTVINNKIARQTYTYLKDPQMKLQTQKKLK